MTNQPKLSEVLGLKGRFSNFNPTENDHYKDIGYNQCLNDLDQLSPDVDELAKEMFEVCCYPDPTKWEEITQNEKDVWIYRASIVIDKINKWIKK